VPFYCGKNPRIANLFAIAAQVCRSLLAANETPTLVGLNVLRWHVDKHAPQEPLASLPSLKHGVNDGIPVDAGQSLDAANAVAFQKHAQAKQHFRRIKPTMVLGAGRFVRESFVAGVASEPFRAIPVLAFGAGCSAANRAQHD
jgi:hypothetical protein